MVGGHKDGDSASLASGRAWLLPVAIVLLCAGLLVVGSAVDPWFAYRRDAIVSQHQLWRLVTAHFLHLNLAHFAMNASALLLIWALLREALSMAQWLYATLAIAAGTGLGLLVIAPSIDSYVGLSGVLHGLVVAGALGQFARRRVESALLLAGVAIKVGYELIAGPSALSEAWIGGRVIYEAHALGALCGIVPGVLVTVRRR